MINLEHILQPADEPRRTMTPVVAARIQQTLEHHEPLVANSDELNDFAGLLTAPVRLDAWQMVKRFGDMLGDNYDLYWGDLRLLRPCLGNEHTSAVFDGVELDYAPLFYNRSLGAANLQALQVARFLPFVQDGGKPLCVALTGENFQQKEYNVAVTTNVLSSISDHVMSPNAKQAVRLLSTHDLLGSFLQGQDVGEELAAFQAAWPEELVEYRDDLLLIAYLSDASAHSGYRLYHNLRHASIEPAVRPDDAQLTFLFEPHVSGAVTLTPDRCQRVLELLPGLNLTRHLLIGESSPYPRETEVLTEVLEQKLQLSRNRGDPYFWIQDQPFDQTTDKVHIYPDHTVWIARTTENSSRQTDRFYTMPGDGRIWCRVVDHHPIPIFSTIVSKFPVSKRAYAHPNPEIARMQERYEYGLQYRDEDHGHPLTEHQAWNFIEYIENLL